MKKENKAEALFDGFAKYLPVVYLIAAAVFILSIVRSYVISERQIQLTSITDRQLDNESALSSLNEGWILHYADGETQTVTLPYEVYGDDPEIQITKDVTGLLHEGDIIKFDNNRQGVQVSSNGEILYEVNTTKLTRQVSFTDYQLIPIPEAEQAKELKLTFVNTITDHYILPTITYGSYHIARNEIIVNDLMTLIILAVLALFLVIVGIIQIYCRFNQIQDARIFNLGVFILTTSLWGYTDSYLPVISGIPQEVLGVLCYLSIMALPIPICQFVWLSCKKKYPVFQVISLIGALNLILEAVLSSFGLFQLQNTFYSAHILILAVIACSIHGIYRVKKEETSSELDILYSGIIILAAVAMLSLILYWRKGVKYYRICMLYGIFLFAAFLFCYVIVHYVKRMQETQLAITESRIHERLSKYDELTGLPNRRSFEMKLQEMENRLGEIEDAVLIMMDVNGLKIVNDQYGHSSGDDLIIAAARVIETTYGERGNCYRIGGDEFVVILEDFSIPLVTYDRLFADNIARSNRNTRWKLSIAKGASHLSNNYGQRFSLSDWKQEADINMYRNKVATSGDLSRDRAKDLTEIINCIITTVEAKDMYTAAHSERVRELSYCIAQHLGVSDSTIQNMEVAAHLHDIGKIGVPDYILLKETRLTDEEYEKIKEHSQIGADIIGQAKGMKEIANIVLHHHERWDGKGYPEGLSREDIPLESRIIAIADSIDAITSKRVYREAMNLDICRQEIEKNAAVMYDPAIARIVLENWQDIVDIVLLHPKRLSP